MLYNLLTPFKDLYSIFNLFEYITFRAGASAILALLISFFWGPSIIRTLKKNQIERDQIIWTKTHFKKERYSNHGRSINFSTSLLVPTLLFAKLDNPYIIVIIFSTIWMGLVGFLDDYLKVIKKNKKWLTSKT